MMVEPPSHPGVVIAFHSPRTGIGRTMALANVAVLLASGGMRVLVVDADSGETAYKRYLSLNFGLPDRVRLRDVYTLGSENRHEATRLARLIGEITVPVPLIPGNVRYLRLDTQSTGLAEELGAAGERTFVEWLREGVRAAEFDYVLVDCPAGLHGPALELVAELSDVMAVCVPPPGPAIREGAAAARKLRRPSGGPKIVPVLLRADSRAVEELRRSRETCQREFGALAGAVLPVEIPYVARYAYSEELAAVTEPPGRSDGLKPAFEQLARALTDGRYTALADVTVLYNPAYRDWAEWIEHRIERHGITVTRARLGAPVEGARQSGHAVLVVSPAGLDQHETERVRALLGPSLRSRPKVWPVRLDDEEFPAELADVPSVDLRGLLEEDAALELRRRLGLTGPEPMRLAEPAAPRFPRDPTTTNVRGRNLSFVGRDDLLERLRDDLAADPVRRCLLHGPAGLGKSQVALEYCHRFGGVYDLVWWVSCGSGDLHRRDLAALATTLGLPAASDPVTAVLRHLDSTAGRFLLVYDDVPDLARLPQAPATGHLLVTCREREHWSPRDAEFEVGPFTLGEGTALIRKLLPAAPATGAAEVVDTVLARPIAVHLAGAWLRQAAAGERRLDRHVAEAARKAAKDFLIAYEAESTKFPDVVDAGCRAHRVTVELALRGLEELFGPGAVWLVEACAFLAPIGVDLRLLRSDPMRQALKRAESRLADPIMIDAVLQAVDHLGLAGVDLGRGEPLRMHPVVQELVRARLELRGTAGRRRQEIQEVLAAVATRGATDPRIHLALAPHVIPVDAMTSPSHSVRNWVVSQVTYHWEQFDTVNWHLARQIGDPALEAWSQSGDDRVLWELHAVLADVHRMLGKHARARELAQTALREQSRTLGAEHPRTLVTAMTYAVAQRAMGAFDDAYLWDRAALIGLRELYGADHALTGRAMNNVAVSLARTGNPREAIRLAEERVRRRTRIFGEYDSDALWTRCNLAAYLRDAGEYEQSRRVLSEVQNYLGFVAKEHPERHQSLWLRTRAGLAVSHRLLGRPDDAFDFDQEALEGFRHVYGDGFLGTLMCRASLAADLFARGETARAVAEAETVARTFDRLYGRHPFTLAAESNLAVYLCGDGARHQERALRLSGSACDGLTRAVGARHPHTLAALVNHASVLVEAGRLEEAAEAEERAAQLLADMLGQEHPHARLARRSLDDIRARLDDPAAQRGERGHIDIEIPGM
ncbi:FxSxx-COOH system tetratricopeptide repeat protein [Nonomuraea sp. NPDC050783]|uniref:FxSxx-COOH system tetratricopeptide repeat protein n=1 Tax=Nonomuraea sp. NPDC050783 TaxID=3154634 RepID=UPI0034651EDD